MFESTGATGRRSRRPAVAIIGAVSVALLASACTAESVATPSNESTTIDWTSCGDRLECATIPVPMNWGDEDGEAIDLAVIKHAASKPDQKIGTIFTDPGGPGDTGVGFVRDAGDELDGWGDGRFDWIGWDPRGTYGSSPVKCFESDAEEAEFWDGVRVPTTPAESEAFTVLSTDLAQRCGEVMGPVLSHISTADTVKDLDRLRQLVGEEKLTYVGLSYGTVIGQTYANMFPEHVRAMYLDGLVDPVAYMQDAETRSASGASGTDEVFDQFLATCDDAGPDRCALAGHGETAASRVEGLFERARQGQIPAPNADPAGDLTYSDLVVSSYAALRSPALWPDYAEQLNAAAEGDASALATAAAPSRGPGMWAEATKSSAISCLDGPASKPVSDWQTVIEDLTKVSTLSGPIQGWWLWAPCASGWPASSTDRYTGPWDAETEVPILLVGTTYDPATSYENAVHSERLLGNAVLLTHEGYGHLSFQDPSQCIEDAKTRYLVDLETPEPGTVCQSDKKPFM